jgi:hypothetical protein
MVKIRFANNTGSLIISIPKEIETKYNLQRGDEVGFFKEIPETLDEKTMLVLKINDSPKIIF